MFGHSFGGAQAAQFCHDDTRCTAGIDIDGRPFGSVIEEGVRQPFMFLLSAQPDVSDPIARRFAGDVQSIYDRQPPNTRLRVAIHGASHFLFSDDGALLKSELVRRLMRLFGVLGIDGRRQLELTAYCVRSFFDAYLKEGRTVPIDIAAPAFPELRVLP